MSERAGDTDDQQSNARSGGGQPPWMDALAQAIVAGVRGVQPPQEREVMEAEEVAAFLGVDRKTVYDYAGRGVIPCRRLGKRLLFSRSALVVWLGACSKGSSNGDST
jgi:excisionase family DNA binding protein